MIPSNNGLMVSSSISIYIFHYLQVQAECSKPNRIQQKGSGTSRKNQTLNKKLHYIT